MNLYKLHAKPESLDHFEKVQNTNPDFFWQKCKDEPSELKKYEK